MLLQILLHRLTLHLAGRGEIIAGEEEGVKRGSSVFVVVSDPDHTREGVAVHLMHKGSAGLVNSADVHAQHVKGPARCTISPGEARPYVHVRVNEQVQPVFPGFFHDLIQIL
ncbi:hypothetical protein SDC9_203399 [bioreactor metagenome]|uniref:Uncharacterized protein n=1 Tax=bioreactor metagenome TaxID=1076179 RepID=A0A645IWB6_9ZZZZ